MYFNTLPKTEKKDLFGVDYVLKNLIAALTDNSTRLIVIKGLRRVGKTSLLNVALNEAKVDFVKIDVREGNYYVREEFFNFLLRQIQPKTGNFLEKIFQKISGLGLSYKELSAQVFFSKNENFPLFFSELNQQFLQKKKTLIIAFDEAQLLKEIGFDYFLASIYDNYPAFKIILTGSEIGLLDKFIGKANYQAPLYGRAYWEVNVKKISAEDTRRYLEEGFSQIGKKISFEEIKEIVEYLDGIIGWATHYGWLRSRGLAHAEALEKTQEEGKSLLQRELKQFLERRKAKEKYLFLLKAIAKNNHQWATIKLNFAKNRMIINDSQLHLYLKELLDYGFIEKSEEKYYLSDPLTALIVKH